MRGRDLPGALPGAVSDEMLSRPARAARTCNNTGPGDKCLFLCHFLVYTAYQSQGARAQRHLTQSWPAPSV